MMLRQRDARSAGKKNLFHIVPQSRFHFKTVDDPEFKVCWSLDNLQPLWAKDNWSKNDKTMSEWRFLKTA